MQEQTKLFKQIDVSHYMIDEDTLNIVLPGDLITKEEGFMNGHGTYRIDNNIYSGLLGTVQITNKLIMVNALKSKYTPQVGDIVVGQVSQIANRRWKVDIKASASAYLSLNSTYIPEQRKKNQEDQFNMRKIMQEGDIIVAEVHSVNNDKTFNLHTRNPRYGKLEPGTFIQAAHKQIKRQKHHMISINNIGLILGNNGNIYLSNYKRNQGHKENIIVVKEYTEEELKNISLLASIIQVLKYEGLQISEVLLKELLEFVSDRSINPKEILKNNGNFKNQLLDRVRERIPKRIDEISTSLKRN